MHTHTRTHTHTHTHTGHFGIDDTALGLFHSLARSRINDSNDLTTMKLDIQMLKKVFIRMEEEVKTIKVDAKNMKTAFTRVEEGLNSIKKRQDLVFLKQDQIQSTLAGELPTPKHPFISVGRQVSHHQLHGQLDFRVPHYSKRNIRT